jgi:hypothetical protein
MIICKELSRLGTYDVVVVVSGTSGQTAAFDLNEKKLVNKNNKAIIASRHSNPIPGRTPVDVQHLITVHSSFHCRQKDAI